MRSALTVLLLAHTAAAGLQAGSSSVRAFSHVYRVLQHPRCMNCHPAGNRPLQGNDSHPHRFGVQRGADGMGLANKRCARCHLDRNQAGPRKPPGAPQLAKLNLPAGTTRWQLPHSQHPLTFQGRSAAQLCRQLLNPSTNGGLKPEALIEHVEQDPLVHWGWQPGAGRTTPPGTHQEFVDAMRVWIENGPSCPEEGAAEQARFGIAGWRANDQNVSRTGDRLSGRGAAVKPER
ncbi:MAG: hypothetical protein IT162_23460 [Bryobacterales bacterium]|nr:hypothetical protein [Bryobacterales bacterium]